MIAGCYSLHLYCRNENLPVHYGEGPVPTGHHHSGRQGGNFEDFTGQTLSECRAQSKKAGWTWQQDGDVTCPLCNRKPTS